MRSDRGDVQQTQARGHRLWYGTFIKPLEKHAPVHHRRKHGGCSTHLQDFKFVHVDFTPGLLQSGNGTHVHPSWEMRGDEWVKYLKRQTWETGLLPAFGISTRLNYSWHRVYWRHSFWFIGHSTKKWWELQFNYTGLYSTTRWDKLVYFHGICVRAGFLLFLLPTLINVKLKNSALHLQENTCQSNSVVLCAFNCVLFFCVLTDDGHEGVEVADVETLLSHVDEELDDPRSVFLLHWLWWEHMTGSQSELSSNMLLYLITSRY